MTIVALAAPWLAPRPPQAQNLAASLMPPAWMQGGSSAYFLGTDPVGRDVLSNVIHGIRVSYVVGLGATLISAALGVAAGVISGYYGGRVDSLLMRLTDVQLALPDMLIALAAMAALGRGMLLLTVVIGVTSWAVFARTARGSTLVIMKTEYIEAARALGVADRKAILRHVLPNVLTPVIILAAIQMPRNIMLESTLSFLGVGLPVTTPSLGLLIARGFRVLFSGAWWITVFPGLVLMLSVLAVNLLGDWLRDVLDPRFHPGRYQS
jgi:peptide/nickel transport system permease protein